MDSNHYMRRRRFLQGAGAASVTALAGCSGDSGDSTPTGTSEESPPATSEKNNTDNTDDTTTEEGDEGETTEEPVDRPDNFRWDMVPGRNEQLREELGQYVEGDVGGLVEDHPAFDYSTESERDDVEVDFEALKLYRDSNFDIMAQNHAFEEVGLGLSSEEYVEAFVNEDLLERTKTEAFISHDSDAPDTYDAEAWLNADTVEESLDLGHSFLGSSVPQQRIGPAEQGAILREAYKQHHDFDVLAWETNMGASGYRHDTRITGLMYSPDDDKLRAHDVSPPTEVGQRGEDTDLTRKWHSEIQEWNVFNEGGELFHPLLFHTDEWNRQNPGFKEAKVWASTTVSNIANNAPYGQMAEAAGYTDFDERGNIAPTTGLTKQLTRTMLEYNENDADFQDLWDFGNITDKLQLEGGNYIIDTATKDDNYDGVFDGEIAVYEVEDESVVDEVWSDQAGEYDKFGQVYDELEEVA